MSGGHTPGPWHWASNQLGIAGTQWALAPGILIADTNNGTPGGDSIDRANAALIAAAPELLAALRGLLDEIKDDAILDSRAAGMAYAAIAKATTGAA